jgi:RHS repeat-associated protein
MPVERKHKQSKANANFNYWLNDAITQDEPEEMIFFYHKDLPKAFGMGSSTQISDIDANIIQHIEYLPYGETFFERRLDDYWTTPYKFNAKELDEETGLYYYGARYYTPEVSIWLSVDPLAHLYSGISPYAYCTGNPLVFIDPDGRIPWPTPYSVILKTGERIFRWISSGFGHRVLNGEKQNHRGIDINLGKGYQDKGVPVYATHNGIVVKVGGLDNAGGYRITIRSEDGSIQTSYMHLNEKPKFSKGDEIKEGQTIGHIGNSAKNTENANFGPHLHYELFIKNQKGILEQVDPFIAGMVDPIDPQKLIDSNKSYNSSNYSNVYMDLNPPVATINLNEVQVVARREPIQRMEPIKVKEIPLY